MPSAVLPAFVVCMCSCARQWDATPNVETWWKLMSLASTPVLIPMARAVLCTNLPGGGPLKGFRSHLRSSCVPQTAAATKACTLLCCSTFHEVWDFVLQHLALQAREIPISEVPCSTWYIHCVPWKKRRGNRLATLVTLIIGCKYTLPFSRQSPETTTDGGTEKTTLFPQNKYPGYGETKASECRYMNA